VNASAIASKGFSGVIRNGFRFVGVTGVHVNVVRWDDKKDALTMHAAWV